MRHPVKFLPLTFILFCVLCAGCAKEPPFEDRPLSEINREFADLLKSEYGFGDIVLRQAGETVWLYVPGERGLFTFRASRPTGPARRDFSVEYIDGEFRDRVLVIEYDIIPATRTEGSQGLSTAYSEAFSKEYRAVFSALGRAYLENEDKPRFFVHVAADIVKGAEVVNTFYLKDIIRYQTGALPHEEYQKRVLSKTRGDLNIVGDADGRHVAFRDIALGDFLAEQIVNRVKFKYQRSDFPPSAGPASEVLAVVARTFDYYDFADFSEVVLVDLRNDETLRVNRDDLGAYAPGDDAR